MFRTASIARGFRASVVCALLAHLVLVLAMAASPALHDTIHDGAGHADHLCAVTLFASGGVEDGAAPVLAPEFARLEMPDAVRVDGAEVAAVFLAGAVLEHAPPFIS